MGLFDPWHSLGEAFRDRFSWLILIRFETDLILTRMFLGGKMGAALSEPPRLFGGYLRFQRFQCHQNRVVFKSNLDIDVAKTSLLQ